MKRRDLARAAAGALFTGMGIASTGITGVRSGASPGPRAHGGARSLEGRRSDFPILESTIDGRPLVYLDSAATTQRPRQVLEAMNRFYQQDNANPGSKLHSLARRAHDLHEDARRKVAAFVGARADEIVWTRGTTEAINLVATAWASANLRRGDEILLSVAEHSSNLLPWQLAAHRTGAVLRYMDVDDDGRLQPDEMDRLLSDRTRLVAFSHVSNVAGHVNPAEELCARARRAGATVLVDAAQSVPHLAVDVRRLGCDFLAFSGHKMLGPMGVGVLWGRRDVLQDMPPYQAGSNMAHAVGLDSYELESAAYRFAAGTPNVAGAVGLAAAVSWLQQAGDGEIRKHEAGLVQHALARLREVPGLRLLGPGEAADRIPVFSFTIDGFAPREILAALDQEGIAIRAGDLSALPLLERLGTTSAARASCYVYTPRDHVDRLADALLKLAQR